MQARTLYGAELTIGETFETDAITVTEAHVFAFAGLTGDVNPLHMDRDWAEKEGPFGERVAHGMLGLAMATGLHCKLDQLALIAFLGIEDWRFVAPIRFGDTIRCRLTLAGLRPTSRPGRSVLRVEVDLLTQNDKQVQKGAWSMLILDNEESS